MPMAPGPDVSGAAVVTLRGECDAYDEPLLASHLRERIAARQAVIVDFSAASFVDSVVLGSLLALLREAEGASVPFVLYLPEETGTEIHRVFSISGLDQLLPLRATWLDAVDAAGEHGHH
jgi:anti-sigma B factor antagonist